DPAAAEKPASHFAQCWNYRYSSGYGSAEFSRHHFGARGHDVLRIESAHVVEDGKSLFLSIPDLQPVNQLHLRLQPNPGVERDLFMTVHRLDEYFQCGQPRRTATKTIEPHPILADLTIATTRVPNPWLKRNHQARPVVIEAGKNLTYATRSFTAAPGEALRLTLKNPDVVPHNWALLKPGSLQRVGELTNRLVADPEAAARHYIPRTEDVLVYSDVVSPQDEFTIWFKAPEKPGRYPYLCTFPGHWMVMNGELIVE
ncbi:MAG: plastocyanin/azurin family copper-binding protein, partial [Planctomycetaceae bacterium]|nr:plastocyanin/azurin family copper-binding protein [Planctomycetaceae bacterium]